jgi:hypothetical protein
MAVRIATSVTASGRPWPRTRRHMIQAAIRKAALVTALTGSAQ